jgi:hypothetical protein
LRVDFNGRPGETAKLLQLTQIPLPKSLINRHQDTLPELHQRILALFAEKDCVGDIFDRESSGIILPNFLLLENKAAN